MFVRILHFFYKRLSRLGGRFTKKPALSYSAAMLGSSDGNKLIKKKIEENEPLMVARFGAVELACVMNYLSFTAARKSGWKRLVLQAQQGADGYWKGWSANVRREMGTNAGFFPATDEMLTRFAQRLLQEITFIDLLGVWDLYGESELHKNFFSQAVLMPLESIEPYYHAEPWSTALKGKKVLVIHPFAESITENYRHHSRLFSNEVLPSFELKTIKAVQSIANNNTSFNNWFEALDNMCQQVSNTDFDVAIIGAGAYGMPLAGYIKKLGKQAIHMGGPTQILFGIKGSRWDNRDFFKNLYNDFWNSSQTF